MKRITLGNKDARFCLIQAVDAHDEAALENEYAHIHRALVDAHVLLAAFRVDDWNSELSPWKAPSTSLRFNFEGKADETLKYVLEELIPSLKRQLPDGVKFIIGGYSLAGLFALWACTKTDVFPACAAASPSLWFPGWLDYARKNPVKAQTVYLSLGTEEENGKHPLMSTVGDCVREQKDLLTYTDSILEWNKGGHFTEPEVRTAKGFVWCVRELLGEPAWEIVSSEYISKRPWLTARKDAVRLPDGRINPEYWILEFPDWVNVIAVTKDGKMVMERQYRHGSGNTCYELPCGVIEEGETPLEAARRELMEETGFGGGSWQHFMDLSANPSNHTNYAHTFLAVGVEKLSSQHLDATEDLSVHLLDPSFVKGLLERGEIIQALMAAPLYKYFSQAV